MGEEAFDKDYCPKCKPRRKPSRALTAIGETIGQPCSICRSRHGSEVRHACE